MITQTAHFTLGDIVRHQHKQYRGIVIDVDPEFDGPEQWYEANAERRPPREQPWYSLLVDDSEQVAYVAEENLETDDTDEPVSHPAMAGLIGEFQHGRYTVHQTLN